MTHNLRQERNEDRQGDFTRASAIMTKHVGRRSFSSQLSMEAAAQYGPLPVSLDEELAPINAYSELPPRGVAEPKRTRPRRKRGAGLAPHCPTHSSCCHF